MPIVLPTGEEFASMSWHSRGQVSARIRSAIDHAAERRALRESALTRAFALLHPMDQARVLLDGMPVDPDWQQHQAALVEAVR